MASDDLNTPLGLEKIKQRRLHWPFSGPQLLAGAMTGCGLFVVCWAVFANDPLGGEPTAVVPAKLATAPAAAPEAQGDGKEHSRRDGPSAGAPPDAVAAAAAKAAAPPPGSKTVTIIDGSNGQRQDIVLPGNQGGAAGDRASTAPRSQIDQKLLEISRHGAIPKIAPDGTRPSAAYARPRDVPANRKDAPRIAIVIGSIGISASGTADAFTKLPAPVSFAIPPYGADLDKLAERARGENHEVLLQVPMEPFDYPDNDPGPQTLLTSLSSEQNIDRLQWLMSRMQGYVGITGYMGARFSSSEQALAPVMREVAKRGLVYVDDGSSPRSVAGQVAGGQSLPFAKTDLVLDETPSATEIDRALARLELMARDNGSAVGMASAQPGTIARIAEWAKAVESRGFLLVPVSMVAIKPKSS